MFFCLVEQINYIEETIGRTLQIIEFISIFSVHDISQIHRSQDKQMYYIKLRIFYKTK